MQLSLLNKTTKKPLDHKGKWKLIGADIAENGDGNPATIIADSNKIHIEYVLDGVVVIEKDYK